MEFSTRIIRVSNSLEKSRAGNHIADQLLRSGTPPFGIHGEAEGAESRDNFIHKLKVYIELRETRRWLRLVQHVPLVDKPALLDPPIKEAEELIRFFASSLRTARGNREPGSLER